MHLSLIPTKVLNLAFQREQGESVSGIPHAIINRN